MISSIDSKMIKPLLADLLNIKKSVSRINGTITKLAELAFIDYLQTRNILSKEEATRYAEHSLSVSAYANGYDIWIPEKNIVAEIKALIPFGKNRFGGAQIQALEKDVEGLLNPKAKKSKRQKVSEDAIKYLVLLSSQDYNAFTEAVNNLKEYLLKKGCNVTEEWPNDDKEIKSDTVYIVTIALD